MRAVAALMLLCCSCAAAPEQRPQAPVQDDCDCEHPGSLADLYDAQGRPRASTTAVSANDPAPATERWATQSLRPAEAPPQPRPHRVGRRDIHMRNARLDSALRTLAAIGRFNLVLDDSHSEQVTLDLRKVEPYDALLALAEARGMSIRYDGNIVIVGRD